MRASLCPSIISSSNNFSLYSMGIVLYQMATGDPHPGADRGVQPDHDGVHAGVQLRQHARRRPARRGRAQLRPPRYVRHRSEPALPAAGVTVEIRQWADSGRPALIMHPSGIRITFAELESAANRAADLPCWTAQ